MELRTRLEREFLPYVLRPGRFLGNEYNVVLKDAKQVKLRFALAYPDVYDRGMSDFGYEILYYILNQQHEVWAERIFLLDAAAEAVLIKKQFPLFSLESKTSLRQFHLIYFFIPLELTYPNILRMLALADIPYKSAERSESWPIILGGSEMMLNPEPIAEFVDGYLIGSAAEILPDVSKLLLRLRQENCNKAGILKELSKVSGIYIPSYYNPVYNSFGEYQGIEKIVQAAPGRVRRRATGGEVGNTYSIRPMVPLVTISDEAHSPNIFSTSDIVGRISPPVETGFTISSGISWQVPLREGAIKNRSGDRVDLLSDFIHDSNLSACWSRIKEELLVTEQNLEITVPGGVLNMVPFNKSDFFFSLKRTPFTFFPLAGSQRLRDVISNPLREEVLFHALKLLLQDDWHHIRLVFKIGLPTEKEADIIAIGDLVERCVEVAEGFQEVCFTVEISAFSPRPYTPFQWEKHVSPAEFQQKFDLLLKHLKYPNVRLVSRPAENSSVLTALARGDRCLSRVIERAWKSGAGFQSLDPEVDTELWWQAFREAGISPQKYLEAISITLPLPWDHIDHGLEKSFLKKEKFAAYQGKPSENSVSYSTPAWSRRQNTAGKSVDEQGLRGELIFTKTKLAHSIQSSSTSELIKFGRRGRRRPTTVSPARKVIRVCYSKLGPARFISHLDVVRVFERAARRARIPLVYTQGKRPHPRISFGPPLGLGIASVAEYLDMLIEIGKEVNLLTSLNPYLPEGIRILRYKTLFKKIPALTAVINRITYQVNLEEGHLPEDWIEAWLAESEVWIQRVVKEETRMINIRHFVSQLELSGKILLITIGSVEGRTARVTEVLESLLEPHGIDYRRFFIQRTGQFIEMDNTLLTPLDMVV